MKNKTLKRGQRKPKSLHELNQEALRNDRAIKATNLEAAKKAGQAVQDVLNEKRPDGKRQRKNLTAPPAGKKT